MTDAKKKIFKYFGFNDIDKYESIDDYLAASAANHKMHEKLYAEKIKELENEGFIPMTDNNILDAHGNYINRFDAHRNHITREDMTTTDTLRDTLKNRGHNDVDEYENIEDYIAETKKLYDPLAQLINGENENVSQVQSETDNG